MTSRAVVFLILVYVCIDFGNPLLPGAVQLVEGSLHAVECDRNRGDAHEALGRVSPGFSPMTATSPPATLARIRRQVEVLPHPPLLVWRPLAREGDPPSAPDH